MKVVIHEDWVFEPPIVTIYALSFRCRELVHDLVSKDLKLHMGGMLLKSGVVYVPCL
jgi:hypothetical protein